MSKPWKMGRLPPSEKEVEVVRAFCFPDHVTSSAEHGILEEYLKQRNQ
jgi:hypothetical protein